MKVALVNQPWGQITPPVVSGGSIPLILYELGHRLAKSCDVLYYTRGRFRKHEITDRNIRFRYLPIVADKVILKLLDRVGRFPDFRKPQFASRWSYLGYAVQLALDVAREQCDVVHIINMSQFVPIVRKFNPDTTIILHMECEWLNQLDQEMIRRRIEQCDLVVGCSRFITEKIERRFPELAGRCVTVYNGVDVQRFTPAPRESSNDTLRIVFVGRVAPTKGVHTLLEAFGKIAPSFPNARLQIVGPEEINPPQLEVPFADDPKVFALEPLFVPGRYRAIMNELAAPWGDRVEFLGNLPQTDALISRYQSADLCVIPSEWEEPFGIPVIEAMAAGAPVIATHGGAFPELVVHDTTGLLVERANATDLANAMAQLLASPEQRLAMGRAGRQRAVDLFSWDRIAPQLLEQYRRTTAPSEEIDAELAQL